MQPLFLLAYLKDSVYLACVPQHANLVDEYLNHQLIANNIKILWLHQQTAVA